MTDAAGGASAAPASFALIHSPLVGPSTWRWVAELLLSRGSPVVVPSLVDAAVTGDPMACAAAAATALQGRSDLVLVGHSGAGPLLPYIARSLDAPPRRLVFVDAAIPPCAGEFQHEREFINFLTQMAEEGQLPPWSEWFGEAILHELVPDAARRQAIEADLPRLPLRYFGAGLPMPAGWCGLPGGFVLLSEGYRRFVAAARRNRWPVLELPGKHLDLVNRPEAIAGALLHLAGELGVSS